MAQNADDLRRSHYEIEKALAARLRAATAEERRTLYPKLYDELYRLVPHHPQLVRVASDEERAQAVDEQMRFLARFLGADSTFLEVGPGDCSLSFEVAKRARAVVAVDVSDEITRRLDRPANFRVILSDGSSVDVPPGSIDLAYSNQLMEHLHPDDAMLQIRNIFAALKPGGRYVCITPNRLSGPHDVSQYYDRVATGFHLKEYTTAEVCRMFRAAGFKRVHTFVGAKGRYAEAPAGLLAAFESVVEALPYGLRHVVAHRVPFRPLLGNIRIVGEK